MRLTYVVLHVQCGCNTVLVYLPKLAALAVGCCLFSRDVGAQEEKEEEEENHHRSACRPLGSFSSRPSCRPLCAMLLFSIYLI